MTRARLGTDLNRAAAPWWVRVAAISPLLALAGCFTPPTPRDYAPPPPPAARLLDLCGGTHWVSLAAGERWYCGFGSAIVVVEPKQGRAMRTVELREPGDGGSVCDLIQRSDGTLVAVLEDTSVVELELDERGIPEVVLETDSAALGIAPRSVREIDGVVYASGRGGVVALSDPGRVMLTREFDEADVAAVGPVVETVEGPAAPVGRRLYRLEGGKYLGAATAVVELPAGTGPDGGLAYVLQGATAAEVGLLGPDLRATAMRPVPGIVRRIRVFDGRLWVVDDEAIVAYPIEGDQLGTQSIIRVIGALDVAPLRENVIAVCGHFGRAFHRLEASAEGPGDTFFAVTREPGDLRNATHDGRLVVASGPGGLWRYDPARGAELVEIAEPTWMTPKVEATAIWGTATIDPDGSGVTIDQGLLGPFEWRAPDGVTVQTILAVGNSLWIGHDRGIELLQYKPLAPESDAKDEKEDPPGFRVIGGVRVDGPVRFLFPQRVGTSVNFVSDFGGFGVMEEK